MPRPLDWAARPAPAFAGLDPERTIAVLPAAAIEQHGPHLPLGVDTMIMEGMLDTVRSRFPADADIDLAILPVQAVGKSNEHLWAAGTLTLSAETALRAWTEIGLSIARAGVRKIVIVNSHGGNLDLVSILSRELRVRAGMLAVRAQWFGFGAPDGMYSEEERRYGIHGGDAETSLMLHFRPETVDMALADNFRSSAEGAAIPPIGAPGYGWIASDLNPAGVVGDASAATAEKGRLTAEHQADGFIELLRAVRARPLDGLSPTPDPFPA